MEEAALQFLAIQTVWTTQLAEYGIMNSILCSDQEAAHVGTSTEHFGHKLAHLENVRSTVATIIVNARQEFEATREPKPQSILERIEVPEQIDYPAPVPAVTPSPRLEPVVRQARPSNQLPKPKINYTCFIDLKFIYIFDFLRMLIHLVT